MTKRPGLLSLGSVSAVKGVAPLAQLSSRTTTSRGVPFQSWMNAAYTVLSLWTAGTCANPSWQAVSRASITSSVNTGAAIVPSCEASTVELRPPGAMQPHPLLKPTYNLSCAPDVFEMVCG